MCMQNFFSFDSAGTFYTFGNVEEKSAFFKTI